MRSSSLASILALAPSLLLCAPAAAQPYCTRQLPQYGTLRLEVAVPVTVNRVGQSFQMGSGGVICAGDAVLAPRAARGAVLSHLGPPLQLRPGGRLDIPRRDAALRGGLLSGAWRARLFDPRQVQSLGSPLGDAAPGFALLGLDDGSALLGPGRRQVTIPVLATDGPQTLELWAPGGDEPLQVRQVPERTSEQPIAEITFRDIRLMRGEWTLILRGRRRLRGRFTVVENSVDGEARDLLGGQEASVRDLALTAACLDPLANGLDAFQHLGTTEDRRLVLSWQGPSSVLGCHATTLERRR